MIKSADFLILSHHSKKTQCFCSFCLVLNVAAGKAPMQSSVAEGGIPQKAVDGSTSTFFDLSTCSLTEVGIYLYLYKVVISVCLFVWIEIEFN